jgi:hypothetical protein
VGEPTGASRILTIIGPTVITLWLLVIGILLVRKGRDRRIDQMAATGEPAAYGWRATA